MFKRILLIGLLLVVQSVHAISEKVFQNIIDDRAKEIHIKADEIDQRIASAFVKPGHMWAYFRKPSNGGSTYTREFFLIQQHKYPEPVVLSVGFIKEIREDLLLKNIRYGGNCEINAWVSFDKGQQRFMFKFNEIICEWQVNNGDHNPIYRKFKANIKGKVFDVDFEEGIKVDNQLNPQITNNADPKIGKNQSMYVVFEGSKASNSEQR